jgi:hypothetical protein
MHDEPVKYGARVYQVSESVLLIKQTVKRGTGQNGPYAIDGHKEAHANLDDDAAIVKAVRSAIKGNLTTGKK